MLKQKLCSTGVNLLKVLPLGLLLGACSPTFSPNTYSSSAVQKASKVDSGVVVGVRKVAIRVDSSLATATGAAAGGIGGSQVADGAVSALGALGGAVVGGLTGSEVGHKVQDTYGYEYIVRKADGDLLSVTQKDKVPLKVGQRVLLIQGTEARIVNDYTEPVETEAASSAQNPQSPETKTPAQSPAAVVETPPAQTAVSGPATVSTEGEAGPDAKAMTSAGTLPEAEPKDAAHVPVSAHPAASNMTVIPVDTEPQNTAQPEPDLSSKPTPAAAQAPAPGPDTAPGKDMPSKTTANTSEPQNSEPTPSGATEPTPSGATEPGSITHGPGSAH